jgi:hypothetical protein
MMKLTRSILLLATLPTNQIHAAGAPDALRGKSVILSWSETRQQRHVGEPSFYPYNASVSLTVYVSTAGRVFSRRTTSTRAGAGTIERAPGGSAGQGKALFGGQTMTLIGVTMGGAYRTSVDFDASFTSCSGRVVLAFQSGRTSITLSPISKRYLEIKSTTVSGMSCSIRAGNVLAGAT